MLSYSPFTVHLLLFLSDLVFDEMIEEKGERTKG